MKFVPLLQADERVICQEFLPFGARGGEPFCITVTNLNLHMPVNRAFAVSDPWVLRSIPVRDITRLTIGPMPYGLLSQVLVVVVLLLFALRVYTVLDLNDAVMYGILAFLLLAGRLAYLLPRPEARVTRLLVSAQAHRYVWRIPVPLASVRHQGAVESLDRVIRACRKAGVRDIVVRHVVSGRAVS